MRKALLVLACSGILFAVAGERGEAHKPVTSKYTYNDDVFPILRDRCARCHVPGGVAPMSLMTYEEAFPWGESIRAELVAAHMPPAAADAGFGDVKRAHALSAREIDVLLTWASGGNPRGALDRELPKVALKNEWTLGAPDLALPMPEEVTLGPDVMDDRRTFTIATATKEARWIRAVDLLPGNPAIVRSAVVALKVSGAPERVLARWLPGQDAESIGGGAAFRLPAGAELAVRIRYKKTWMYEGKAMSDRSTVGLYFAQAADAHELTPLPIASSAVTAGKGEHFSFSRTLDQDVQAFAVDAGQSPDDLALQVEAVTPDGRRAPLVRFVTRADWTRRYWFEKPLALPSGTRIEISGVVEDPELMAAAFGGPSGPLKAAGPRILTLALDVVASPGKPSAP